MTSGKKTLIIPGPKDLEVLEAKLGNNTVVGHKTTFEAKFLKHHWNYRLFPYRRHQLGDSLRHSHIPAQLYPLHCSRSSFYSANNACAFQVWACKLSCRYCSRLCARRKRCIPFTRWEKPEIISMHFVSFTYLLKLCAWNYSCTAFHTAYSNFEVVFESFDETKWLARLIGPTEDIEEDGKP